MPVAETRGRGSLTRRHIFLSEINFGDYSFPFSLDSGSQELRQSLAELGVLQTPLLAPGEGGRRIVCGRRRLGFLRDQGVAEVEVLLAEGWDEDRLFQRALAENRADREFNLLEIADLFVRAAEIFAPLELENHILPLLPLPRRERFFRRCRFLAGGPEKLRLAVSAGIVDGETVDLLADWEPLDQERLLDVSVEFSLRRNKLKEVVGRLDDLARRDRLSPATVLETALDKLGQTEPGDQAAVLRRNLREMLYPELEKARCNFLARRERLGLSPALDLQPPPDFEGGRFNLTFSFTDSGQWRRALTELGSVKIEDIDELCRRP